MSSHKKLNCCWYPRSGQTLKNKILWDKTPPAAYAAAWRFLSIRKRSVEVYNVLPI